MSPTKRTKDGPPSFVKGRKARISVADSLVNALWRKDQDLPWPESTFEELREPVSKLQGYRVAPSTIRSSIYQHAEIFERVKSPAVAPLRWRLTKQAKTGRIS